MPFPGRSRGKISKNWSDSLFHIDVRMVTCVHGIWSKSDHTKTSFIVFHCEFLSKEESFVNRVKVQWEFMNDVQSQGPPSNPSVAARGPNIMRIYNPSEEEVHDTFRVEAGVDAEVPIVKPGLKMNWGRKKGYKRQYFGEVKSGWDHASNMDHRYTRVWWDYKQNKQKKDGVSPAFRIAVLLKRETDSPFKGIFTLSDFDAGWKYKLSMGWKDFWGQTEPDLVDPVTFNPKLPPVGWSVKEDEKKREPEDENQEESEDERKQELPELGDLATDEDGLGKEHAWIWGVDLGT